MQDQTFWFKFYEHCREKKVKVVGRREREEGNKKGWRERKREDRRRKVDEREEVAITEAHVGPSYKSC